MHSHVTLRLAAVVAVSIATLTLASNMEAQRDSAAVSTECGAGFVEVCGEVTTFECGWEWGWKLLPFIPFVGYLPSYECEVDLRRTLYRNMKDGGGGDYSEQ